MRKTTTEVICRNCGISFYLPAWQAKSRTSCSLSCSTSFRMNKTSFGEKVRKNIQSEKVRASAKKTYESDEYKNKRSQITKEMFKAKPELKSVSRNTMLKLHKKIHADPVYLKIVKDSAIQRIKDGSFGGGMIGSAPSNSKGILGGKASIHLNSGITMRSSWEVAFANILDTHEINWAYEPQRFRFSWTNYLPDFKLNLGNKVIYIDVKPSRRFEVQPELKTRYDKIISEFSKLGERLVILDRADFQSFIRDLKEDNI